MSPLKRGRLNENILAAVGLAEGGDVDDSSHESGPREVCRFFFLPVCVLITTGQFVILRGVFVSNLSTGRWGKVSQGETNPQGETDEIRWPRCLSCHNISWCRLTIKIEAT